MRDRRLLYLDNHRLSASLWRRGAIVGEAAFALSSEGRREFAEYLARHANSVYSLLANVAEEGFHTESIPFLRGGDRNSVVERKLGQLFFDKALTAALSLGYEKSTRKNERVLFAALNDASFFAPWLDAIRRAGAPLCGIFSLPLLSPCLLNRLGIRPERCLLLSIQDQSIRQSYLEAGQLCFSRLAPLTDASAEGIAQAFASETHKLRQYLASQRMIGRKDAVVAFILAHDDALPAIRSACANSETLQYQFLGLAACAERVGMKTPPASSHCEALFLHLLATSPPRIQFADDDQRHGFHLAQIESALLGASALALAVCLLYSGNRAIEAYALNAATLAVADEAREARQRYEAIVKTFPALATTSEALRQVAARYGSLNPALPERLYRDLSTALAHVPEAELEAIDWSAATADSRAPAPAGKRTSPAAAADATPFSAGSEAIVVRGTLRLGPDADARQTLAVFNRLVSALEANPDLHVEIVQRPFDLESGRLLKGGDAASERVPLAPFALRVERRVS